jgi:hypothetical protein
VNEIRNLIPLSKWKEDEHPKEILLKRIIGYWRYLLAIEKMLFLISRINFQKYWLPGMQCVYLQGMNYAPGM